MGEAKAELRRRHAREGERSRGEPSPFQVARSRLVFDVNKRVLHFMTTNPISHSTMKALHLFCNPSPEPLTTTSVTRDAS